jgi:hypothetical protein
MTKLLSAFILLSVTFLATAQDRLPACAGDFIKSEWSNCQGKYDWGSYIYVGEFLKNRPHGRGEKRKLDGTLIVGGVWEAGELKQSDPMRCTLGGNSSESCWAAIEYQNGQRFVGMLLKGKPDGEGILYFPDGVVRETGRWSSGDLVESFVINKSKFPFDDTVAGETYRAIEAERERNRPPEQRIAFCVQTVQSSGSRFPGVSIPYCQDACNKTYDDKMCSEVGGSKWRVQTASPKTSPPNSQYFAGMDRCSCIGQQYVLNEIKDTPPPAPIPVIQSDTREAELAKREKALSDREKALLEAENKRLREELEAERKKKK